MDILSFSHRTLRKHILEINFTGTLGYPVVFDRDGDIEGGYEFKKIIIKNGKCKFETIGSWISVATSNQLLSLEKNFVRFPNSSCSIECRDGWGKIPRKNQEDCCWTCTPCTGNDISSMNTRRFCENCPEFHVTDQHHRVCKRLQPMTIKIKSPFGIGILVITCLAEFLVIMVLWIFYSYRETHIIRASSKGISVIILLGIALGFLCPLIAIQAHSTYMCRVYFYISGMSLVLIIAPLLIKTNRTYRIFRKSIMMQGKSKSDLFTSIFLECLLF